MDIDEDDDFYAPEEPEVPAAQPAPTAPPAPSKTDAADELEEGEEEDEGGEMDEDEDSVRIVMQNHKVRILTDASPGHRHHRREQRQC